MNIAKSISRFFKRARAFIALSKVRVTDPRPRTPTRPDPAKTSLLPDSLPLVVQQVVENPTADEICGDLKPTENRPTQSHTQAVLQPGDEAFVVVLVATNGCGIYAPVKGTIRWYTVITREPSCAVELDRLNLSNQSFTCSQDSKRNGLDFTDSNNGKSTRLTLGIDEVHLSWTAASAAAEEKNAAVMPIRRLHPRAAQRLDA